ncbi:CCA tRNA nucleotidyltransferase [Brevibacillus sp. 179-C 1.1 NHS]|uniref:CCA tRNA nucleotidyltransferase n=1 Tax=Brevibacillus sp. 179-C 1.1 NHS TaxID=3235177 RepID=UPI0039A1E118
MAIELAKRVLDRLEEHGFEAYYVGGCVRDWLLHRPVHDIDICTNAHPSDVIRLFPDHVPTGLKHGTVSVKIEGQLFEVTTYRTEGKYEDYRRPVDVQFVSELRLDLERRDFTMNAMAMDRNQELQDPFDGRLDMEQQLVRAVGIPLERFQEDALRLLRGVRFASQLGFAIEEQTMLAMKKTAPLLAHIAVERVREELNKTIDSKAPEVGCRLLNETKLMAYAPAVEMLFQLSSEHVWRLKHLQTVIQKWSLLLFAANYTTAQSREVCQFLKMSKRDSEAICCYVDLLTRLRPQWDVPESIEWGPLLLEVGWDMCSELTILLQACWWKEKQSYLSQALVDQYEKMPVKTIKDLAITGLDLQVAIQKKPGEWIMRVLESLLRQTALHGLPNTPEALLDVAKKEVAQDEH